MEFILQDRDIQILQQVTKYRFLLSRQIKTLCGFSGQRACDRRTKKLCDNGFLEKKHYIYGVPALYMTTEKAKRKCDLMYITKSIRIEHIVHDVLVIDTAIYLMENRGVNDNEIISERQIKNSLGFGKQQHVPDLVFELNKNKYCVEIELNVKQYNKLKGNVLANYKDYDKQIWFIDTSKKNLVENLNKIKARYNNIEIVDIEKVKAYVKKI